MTDKIELAYGSGNVFRDLGLPNPRIEQHKAILAAKIIGVLDGQSISVRRAHEMTGFAAADFSRARQGKLARFTIDRLMAMLDRLEGGAVRHFHKNSEVQDRALASRKALWQHPRYDRVPHPFR
jgi:predicted XRE-type DNA-binding protein